MKHKHSIFLMFVAVCCLLCLYNKPVFADTNIPKPIELYFSSGAGAWSTGISIQKNGKFKGSFHDADMGSTGTNYPNGTLYYCNFSGSFSNIKKVGENKYTLTLKEIKTKETPEKTTYKNGVRHIASEPYGMETGKKFILYCPGFSIKKLPQNDDAKSWYRMYLYGTKGDTLEAYMLYNQKPKYVFYGD